MRSEAVTRPSLLCVAVEEQPVVPLVKLAARR